MFECLEVTREFKNRHRETMGSKKIIWCVQNMYTILVSTSTWLRELHDHLMSTRNFTLVMHKIFTWAPTIMKQMATSTNLICKSTHTSLMSRFRVLQKVGAEREKKVCKYHNIHLTSYNDEAHPRRFLVSFCWMIVSIILFLFFGKKRKVLHEIGHSIRSSATNHQHTRTHKVGLSYTTTNIVFFGVFFLFCFSFYLSFPFLSLGKRLLWWVPYPSTHHEFEFQSTPSHKVVGGTTVVYVVMVPLDWANN